MPEQEELRYAFGKNWTEYVEKNFGDDAIASAKAHLADFLRLQSLEDLTFLDIGCGSGLHSLAALRMGADRVLSFDYDQDSVSAAGRLRQQAGSPANWTVQQGSVLDDRFMSGLPKADVVYSWGVLHHTGDMWQAIRNAAIPMKSDGVFYIALYSSDNYVDPPPQYWLRLKRRYNEKGSLGRRLMEWRYVYKFHVRPAMKAGHNPIQVIRDYAGRGMTFWTDVRDWLGGYPMDFAGLHETQDFCQRELGLELVNASTGEGCSEYLFCRPDLNRQWGAITKARELIPLKGPFSQQGGACYSLTLPHLANQADDNGNLRRSSLMLYEDGRMLGLRHTTHADIGKYGKGRFSHWGENIYFAATDNSDPNTNGRTYSYCEIF